MLIIFDENPYIVEEEKVDSFIKNEFYTSWSFLNYLMYSLNYYDEENNDYFYFNAFKVSYNDELRNRIIKNYL